MPTHKHSIYDYQPASTSPIFILGTFTSRELIYETFADIPRKAIQPRVQHPSGPWTGVKLRSTPSVNHSYFPAIFQCFCRHDGRGFGANVYGERKGSTEIICF